MSQAPLGSDAYLASNASDTTLVDASSSTPGKQGLQEPPKSSLKSKLKAKLSMSQDPAQMSKREPTKSWEARASK
ncbi:hypothetical protein QQZ08_010334 [Neonectria magnoliae]|uniref:Uncharacterized protein n=1 Tax=Neonectria magnoliae TaxID=2732573 RepID=A0ABR1HI50_9HYPO